VHLQTKPCSFESHNSITAYFSTKFHFDLQAAPLALCHYHFPFTIHFSIYLFGQTFIENVSSINLMWSVLFDGILCQTTSSASSVCPSRRERASRMLLLQDFTQPSFVSRKTDYGKVELLVTRHTQIKSKDPHN